MTRERFAPRAPSASTLAEWLRPPDEVKSALALARFVATAKAHYGSRLRSAWLFGSRARRDHRPDSNADVALVLSDFAGGFPEEKMRLSDMAFDAPADSGLLVQAWPFLQSDWGQPAEATRFAEVIANARREGVQLPLKA